MEVAPGAVQIEHRSNVGEARRMASSVAGGLGMDEEAVGRVALVATELAGNVLKHGRGGWCYASPSAEGAGVGGEAAVDLLATDRGSGIADLQQALGNGYSTAGTPGTGIGAVRRQSLEFEVFTQPGAGTVVAARVGPRPDRSDPAPASAVRIRGYAAAVPGEQVSGDTWTAVRTGGTVRLLVADGLGHGPDAAAASSVAARVFRRSRARSASEVVEEIHRGLGSTRGAAVAVAWILPGDSTIRFAGIGNISASIITEEGARGMASTNGTAGYAARTVQEFEYDAPPDALVVMHSDGLRARWNLKDYPGLLRRGASVIAGVLLRDFRRIRDDASVVVARMPAHPGES